MLEQLFGSRTRVKLLRLFLNNPERAFFVRELTRKIGEQINSVRREIQNLKNIGLIIDAEQKGEKKQKKFYQANVDFPLYPELKSLIVKTRMILEKDIVSSISGLGSIQYMALAGLFCDDANSQTDILIVGRVNRDKLNKLIKKMSTNFEREINYTVMTKSEFLYRKDITDRFLYNILDSNKIVVINKFKENE